MNRARNRTTKGATKREPAVDCAAPWRRRCVTCVRVELVMGGPLGRAASGGRAPFSLRGDREALVPRVVGDPLLPRVHGRADVRAVGEGLAHRLVPVVDGLVQERRPLEPDVYG